MIIKILIWIGILYAVCGVYTSISESIQLRDLNKRHAQKHNWKDKLMDAIYVFVCLFAWPLIIKKSVRDCPDHASVSIWKKRVTFFQDKLSCGIVLRYLSLKGTLFEGITIQVLWWGVNVRWK